MSKHNQRARKKEHYYRAAKKQGYRSRSAYKLKQIVKKHKLLLGVDRVLELCCSPGGWTQVLRDLVKNLEIIAVDLEQMKPVEGVTFIEGDIMKVKTREMVYRAAGGSVDLILSDCSPKVSGQWELDVARQHFLVEGTLEIAEHILSSRGKILAKIFQGPGFQEFLRKVRRRFRSVKLVKPAASRSTSAEIYLLVTGPTKPEQS